MNKLTFLATLSFLLIIPAITTHASCGSITGPEDLNPRGGEITTTSISDCADPFGVTIDPVNPYTLEINGESVADGGSATIPPSGQTNVSFSGEPHQTGVDSFLFKHEGGNYEYIPQELPFPEYEDELQYIDLYFPTEAERSLYAEILQVYYEGDPDPYFYDSETSEPLIDATTGEEVENRFWDFYNSFYDDYYFEQEVPPLEPGTYTMVFKEYMLFNVHNDSWLNRFRSFFIPTAYAQCIYCIDPNIYTITFTLLPYTPEPTGTSSVLFLPGIMGSYLYEESDVCLGDGEQRRWFSTSDCDQIRLFTDSTGASINDIYTKSNPDAIAKETLGINLYKSFMAEMDELAEQGIIADFTPLPYDWRLRLDDILKLKVNPDTRIVRFDSSTLLTESYIYKTVEAMVVDSLSGKITIVAHSNGGLLAKVFLNALEEANDPLLDKIDNLILVGAPQAGTPDAIVSLLHGSPILHGVVVQGDTSRALLNTTPFGHHLLPSEIYFDGDGVEVNTPVITIEDGEVTSTWKEQFGSEIQSLSSLQSFLKADSGRLKPASDDLLHPEVVGGYLLDYANQIAEVQASWQPAESIKVYQIAGTGVETVTGLTYFTDYECVRSNYLIFGCAEYEPKLGYRVNHTYDGDETVVAPSALAMAEEEGVERWWVNLHEYNTGGIFGLNFNYVHKNLLEFEEIQNFIQTTISSTAHQTYGYLSNSPITPDIGDRLEFQLHSPLDMSVEAPDGVVSSSTVTIPGAVYRRYGEVQYISLPLPITGHNLLLHGDAPGSFNLEVSKRNGQSIVDKVSYSAVPNLESTIVAVPLDEFSSSTTMSIDFDGDGEIDGVVEAVSDSPAIIVTTPETEEEPTPSSGGRSSGGSVKKASAEGLVAGVSTSMTQEELYLWELIRLLEELKRLLELYKSTYVK